MQIFWWISVHLVQIIVACKARAIHLQEISKEINKNSNQCTIHVFSFMVRDVNLHIIWRDSFLVADVVWKEPRLEYITSSVRWHRCKTFLASWFAKLSPTVSMWDKDLKKLSLWNNTPFSAVFLLSPTLLYFSPFSAVFFYCWTPVI